MPFKTKILFTCFIVVAFDATASLVSRRLEVEYVYFLFLSLVIYVTFGYWGALNQGFVYGMLLGAIAGFTDSTAGWFVSRLIGPFIQPKTPPVNAIVVAITIVTVTLLALALGSVGAVLCKFVGQTRSDA